MHSFKEEQLVRHKATGRLGRLYCLQPEEAWPDDEVWGFMAHMSYGDIELDSPDEVVAVPEPDISPKAILKKLDILGGFHEDGLDINETGPNDDSSIYASGTLDGLPISFVLRIQEVWEAD